MSNKKIYSLVICYDEDTGTVEWLEERINRETELPDDMFETKHLEEFDEYLMDEDELEEFNRKRQSSIMNAPRNTNVASRPNNQGGARVVLPPMGMNIPYRTS